MSKLYEDRLHILQFLTKDICLRFYLLTEGLQGMEWDHENLRVKLSSGAMNVARRWAIETCESDFREYGGVYVQNHTIWRMLGSYSPPQLDYINCYDPSL